MSAVVVVPDDLRVTCSAPVERLLRIEWVTVLLSSVHPGLGWRLEVTLAVVGCITSLNQYRALAAHAGVGRTLMVRVYTLLVATGHGPRFPREQPIEVEELREAKWRLPGACKGIRPEPESRRVPSG